MTVTEKKDKQYVHGKQAGKIIFVLMLAISVILFQNAAKAEEHLLETTEKTIYAGDWITLSDYFADTELESVVYSFSEGNTDTSCVSLNTATGVVKAVSAGSVWIQVTYTRAEETQEQTETFLVTVLAAEEVISSYGSQIALQAFSVYSPKEYTYSFSNDSVSYDEESGTLLVQGFQGCEVSVQIQDYEVVVSQISILLPKLSSGGNLARAIGTDAFTPELLHYTEIEGDTAVAWNVEDETIAAAAESGLRVLALGTTKVTETITAKNGDVTEFTFTLTVTDPQLSKEVYAVAVGVKKKITLTGTCDYSSYEYSTTNTGHAYFVNQNKVYGNSKGSVNLTFSVDGRGLTVKIIVTNPNYKKTKFTMYKGLKKKFSLSGLNKTYSNVTYKVTNKKIAKISSAGKVSALKTGVTKIKATADGKTITVWIEVSTKKAYRASKKAIAVSKTKTTYSQARRMSKGYYDCSSLVSRVYRKYGVYFGSKSGWSPTAAGIGQWCSRNNKVIARKAVSVNKLVPGDLIFYSYTKNGRYRNISHIEIYVGNGMSVSASSSYNRVVHYAYHTGSVVLVARPTK